MRKNRGFETACYIVHYSPLADRKISLERGLKALNPVWITELDAEGVNSTWTHSESVFGVSKRRIAADLGINSRSLSRTRRRARLESYLLMYMSLLGKRFSTLTYGSLPRFEKLPNSVLELTKMHLLALTKSTQIESEWCLVLEDDVIPEPDFSQRLTLISEKKFSRPVWINLNAGAGLLRTSSEAFPDEVGLFRVRPPNTRCSAAYMVNKKYVEAFLDLVLQSGVPDWLPIDVIYQITNRKLRALSFWTEPPLFEQGSETGLYQSSLSRFRDEK